MNDTLHTQIENYLLNKMSEDEARIFSEKISHDSLLEKEVELTAMLIGATKKVGEKKDLADINILRNASSADIYKILNRKKSKTIQHTLFWVTSSVAVLVAAVLLFNFNKQKNHTEELFASYYQPYADDSGMDRGGDEISEQDALLLTDALNFYNNEKYADALVLFDQFSEVNQISVAVFRAVCLLETGKAKQAIQLLEMSITENGEGWEYYQDAQWYLALSYVKIRQLKEAKRILQQIIDQDRVYAEKAKELLTRTQD